MNIIVNTFDIRLCGQQSVLEVFVFCPTLFRCKWQVKLWYTMWWFDIPIHFEMISSIKLMNTSIMEVIILLKFWIEKEGLHLSLFQQTTFFPRENFHCFSVRKVFNPTHIKICKYTICTVVCWKYNVFQTLLSKFKEWL